MDSGMYIQTLIQVFQSPMRADSKKAGFFINRDGERM